MRFRVEKFRALKLGLEISKVWGVTVFVFSSVFRVSGQGSGRGALGSELLAEGFRADGIEVTWRLSVSNLGCRASSLESRFRVSSLESRVWGVGFSQDSGTPRDPKVATGLQDHYRDLWLEMVRV